MAGFKQSVVIARPRGVVFDYLADNENETEWQAGHRGLWLLGPRGETRAARWA